MSLSKGERRKRTIGTLVALFLGGFIALRFQTTSDILQFLPSPDDQRLAQIFQASTRSEHTRMMILSIGAPNAELALRGASALASALAEAPEVAWIKSGPDPTSGEAMYGLYYPRRFHHISASPEDEIPRRLSDDALAAAASDLKQQLAGPMGHAIKALAAGDPLLLFPQIIRRIEVAQASDLSVQDGHFLSSDGRHAIVFLSTNASAFDTPAQESLLNKIDTAFDEINRTHAGVLTLEQTGVNRFSVRSRQTIQSDISRISLVSVAAIVLFLLSVFGSPRLILISFLPLLAATLVGIAAGLALFGRLHGITLAFAATLLGVCIDYPIHYLNHYTFSGHRLGRSAVLRQVWPGLQLGAATTIAGFACLSWASYPGIREIAVVGMIGIAAALAATRLLVPGFVPSTARATKVQQRAARMASEFLEASARGRNALAVILIGALGAGFAGVSSLRWDDNIAGLNTPDPELLREDALVRQRVSMFDQGRFIVVLADDEEAALRATEEIARRLEKAIETGLIAAYSSVHSALWSVDLQRRNRAQVDRADELATRVRRVLAAEGFRPEAFAAFEQALASDPPSPLTYGQLARSPLKPLVERFRIHTPDKIGFFTFLRDVKDTAALASMTADIDGAIFFDQRAFLSRASARYREQAARLFLIGIVTVIVLVGIKYRSVRLTIVACAPSLLAILLAAAALTWGGVKLNLFHVLAFILVFSMGVDYGVFLVQGLSHPEELPVTALSITLAGGFTVLAFGLLSMSHNPVLQSIGTTVSLGVLISLLLAPMTLAVSAWNRRTP